MLQYDAMRTCRGQHFESSWIGWIQQAPLPLDDDRVRSIFPRAPYRVFDLAGNKVVYQGVEANRVSRTLEPRRLPCSNQLRRAAARDEGVDQQPGGRAFTHGTVGSEHCDP